MQLAQRMTPTTMEYWRIVLALATKDIVDALKNKTTLTIIIGLLTMMLTVQATPLLLKLDDRPRLAVFDGARTSLADDLRQAGAVQVLEMRNETTGFQAVQEASGPLLAVTFPADWESSQGELVLNGYLPHWVGGQKADELTAEASQALTAVTNRPITIETETVYPTAESGGYTVMVGIGLVLATILVTTVLVPTLILEEKMTHTLDVLRVSPATMTQVVLGKGLAGVVYGLAAAAVLLAFNLPMIVLWGLMIPAVLAIVLFGVGLGLLVGTMVENQGAIQMWIGLFLIIVMIPLMLAFSNSGGVPDWVRQAASWLPTSAGLDLIRLSFGNVWDMAEIVPKLGGVITAVVLVFAAAVWRLRRWEA